MRAGGLDIGLSKDASVYAECVNVKGIVVVQHLVSWQGQRGRKVDLESVEAEVAALAKRGGTPVYFDPYQGVLMAQRLQRQGVRMVEYPFTAESRKRLFATLLDLVRGRRLRCRPHDAFRRELLSLEVTQTAAGWRVDHRAGRHDDHVIAVALAAQAVAGERVAIDLATQAYVPNSEERHAALDSHVAGLEWQAGRDAPWDL